MNCDCDLWQGGRGGLPHGVDEDDGEDHEESEDHEGDLAPFFQFAAEDDGVETALLEQRGAVLAMMMMFIHWTLNIERWTLNINP